MNKSTISICLSSLILLVIVGGCSYNDCHLNKSSKSETNEEFPRESVLIVSSVDGSLVGLSAETGRELWSIRNEPLVSQSLSKLEFVKDSKKFRLIPSLDGQLYMLEIDGADKGLRALPITADALFSSTFQLSTDSILVGGKDQRVFGFNPFNGEVKYRCGRHGCEQEASFPGEREKCDLLICRRVSHVVRAVDLETGVEQWNFSVGQDAVEAPEKEGRPQNPVVADQTGALAQRGCIVSQGGRDVGRVRFSFGVEAGEIEASVRPPFTRIMWRRRFDASLSRVWLVEDGTVWQLALFAGDNAHQLTTIIDGNQPHLSGNHHGHSGCPRRRSLFLGAHRGHMYVQLEDGSATNTPHPLYVSLAPQNSVCSDSESKQKLIANSLSRRHRVAKMTRYEVAHLNQGFFRPPLQETIQQNNMWFVEHSRQEYYPPSTEPLAIRYGSFLFQKVVLGILVLVVTHLIFTNVYLPHQLNKKLKQNLSNYNITQDCHIVINCSSDSSLNVIDSTSTGLTELPPSSQTVVYESRYLSDYEHVRCLGKGAFGVVFEAKNKVDQYSYAVKRVRVRYSDEARTKMIQEVKAFAHLEHPGIVRYYQAWFELPPPGWQEAKDVEMGLKLREGGSEGSDDWTETEHEESQDSTRCTTTSDWSRASLLNNDQDSLVIFDRSAVPHTSHNSVVSPSLSRVSSDHSNRNHPLTSTHCSHIYLYICMHLYSSRSLKDWLQENQRAQYTRPSTPELLQIFAQIVDAVAYLHSNGLMHRDLKPSNILFDNQNHIRIVDFGLATSLKRISRTSNTTNPQVPGSPHSNLTQANNNSSSNIATVPSGDTNYSSLTSNVGTELYMSPEQCDGSQYDQKVDVFALGIIFIELIVPLSTEMERAIVLIKARQLQFEPWIVDSFPKEIAFASRLLNHDPKERPSCEEIFEDDLLVDVVDVVRLTRQRSRSVSSPRLSSE